MKGKYIYWVSRTQIHLLSEKINAKYIYWVLKNYNSLHEREHQTSVHILHVKNYKQTS